MPEKALTVATYAAGASLATIAIVYVFAPTFFLDSTPPAGGGSSALSSFTSRKTGVVGLTNAANDCFINSVLQALAGLGDLRIYLIRENHRRRIDDAGVYVNAVPEDAMVSTTDGAATPSRPMPLWKIEGLQAGLVTKGLKDMIDQLNERPLVRKTISAVPFVRVLEVAFRQRISRQQQDAQEFLQVVAERLCDEYHAAQRARRYARQRAAALAATGGTGQTAAAAAAAAAAPLDSDKVDRKLASIAAASHDRLTEHLSGDRSEGAPARGGEVSATAAAAAVDDDDEEDEDGFPMEGKIESQIECLTCGFRPRPSEQTFCTLTLNVPQVSSTSLSACFDSMMKTEYIDEFKCEKCRLIHAVELLEAELKKSTSEPFRRETETSISALRACIDSDPEKPPAGIVLPDARYSPKRRIARHFRMIRFPKVLAIHLSRSIYDASNISQKNSAKVSFPERLPLGGLLSQRKYKLLGLVTHKGSHHSGHYESFRRQTVPPPYSNPNTFGVSTVYSAAPTPAATTPRIGSSEVATETGSRVGTVHGSPMSSTHELPAVAVHRSRPSSLRSSSALPAAPTSAPRELVREERNGNGSGSGSGSGAESVAETSSLRSITRSTLSKITSSSRSGSRNGSRPVSLSGFSLRPGSKDGKTEVNGAHGAANGTANGTVNGTANGTANGSTNGAAHAAANGAAHGTEVRRRKKKTNDRWWRISDEKVREASTREVLGMQREVYLLFYELERDPYVG